MAFGNILQGARPTGGAGGAGGGGGSIWDRLMARRATPAGAASGVGGRPGSPMGGAAGMLGGASPAPQGNRMAGSATMLGARAAMGNPMGGAAGMAGGAQQAPGPMGSMAGMLGGRAQPTAAGPAAVRPMNMPNIGSALGGVMSDERTKKEAYLSGLNDRFSAIGGESISGRREDEDEERKKRMGLDMFQSGMGMLGKGGK